MVEDDKDVVTDPNVLLPEGCFITENPTGEKSILLWTENKDCLLSTDECEKWVQTYSHLYQYLTEQAKVKINSKGRCFAGSTILEGNGEGNRSINSEWR